MRPQAKLDWEQIGKWISKGAKGTDIANRLGIHDKTLYRRCLEDLKITFSEFSAQKKATLRMRILELQLELAELKNLQMLIWLGKQYCGQREPEPKISTTSLSGAQLYLADQKKDYLEYKEKRKELEQKNANDSENESETRNKSG